MYVRSEDLVAGKLKNGVPVEPLVLRANAGDCIEVNLTNGIAATSKVLQAPFVWSAPFNTVPVNNKMSHYVGLHPQLLSYDMATSSGMNVGWNSQGGTNQITGIGGQTIKYQWYAGKIDRAANGTLTYTPVEFGALNLFPSDPLFQHLNGLFGQMIIEPKGATWKCGQVGSLADCEPSAATPPTTRTSATVTLPNNGGTFREFSLMISDNIRIEPTVGYTAINYRSEPWQFRYEGNATQDFSCMLSNQLVGGDPQTPIFTANIGDKTRFRLTHPFGTGTSQVFTVHGHVWQRNPYQKNSTVIGDNNLSQWLGSRDNHGSTDHFDMMIEKAGGEFGRGGDYLYSVFQPLQARSGPWGIFRVGNVSGSNTPNGACQQAPKPGYVPPSPQDGLDRFIRPPLNSGKP
jgi:manganese oxidase